eukprot:1160464-Pelagomonas_calceolata.AAC.10
MEFGSALIMLAGKAGRQNVSTQTEVGEAMHQSKHSGSHPKASRWLSTLYKKYSSQVLLQQAGGFIIEHFQPDAFTEMSSCYHEARLLVSVLTTTHSSGSSTPIE